jgi:DNA-binding NarL/FixJ family response regulator
MIAIADDLFRIGLSRLLEDEGVEVTFEPPASAILVDAVAGDVDATQAGCVVALCGSDDDEAVEALYRGAAAVVERGSTPEVIAGTIRAAVAGAVVMPAATAARVLALGRAVQGEQPSRRHLMSSLSPRELQVLGLISAGLANDEIARELVVTASTVKNHIARIMAKVGARNRTHAAVIATRIANVVDPG